LARPDIRRAGSSASAVKPVHHQNVRPNAAARPAGPAAAWAASWPSRMTAADHLLALTFNQINARTLFGMVPISDAEIDRVVTGGVAAFVRAYRPG
jgi:hypothetical protein